MKTFLSIGSGPGMGMATASRFAGEGFRVVLSSRNKSNVAAQADQLRAAGFGRGRPRGGRQRYHQYRGTHS